MLTWFEKRKREIALRPLIREQAFGEALDPDKLERLGRYEVHLDRKLERTLSMLLRLKDLKQGRGRPKSVSQNRSRSCSISRSGKRHVQGRFTDLNTGCRLPHVEALLDH